MKKIWFLLSFLVITGAGCAWLPQAVVVKPDVQTGSGAVVQSKQIQLTVVDERPTTALGTRLDNGMGGQLSIEGNLVDVVYQSLSEGLTKQGFTVMPGKASDGRELRVEIRHLTYNMTRGFMIMTLNIDCSLKGICIIGSTRPYENIYRGKLQENFSFVQSGSATGKYISAVVSQAINELLNDQQLIQCLSK